MTPRLLALPLLALVLTACGGGEDEKAAYVDSATAVCEKADADFTDLAQPTAPADFAPFVADTVAIAEQAQGELRALTPPEDDRADLERKVLDPFAQLVEDGKAFQEKVEAAGTDQTQLLPLLSQRPTSEGVDLEYLRTYGLESCADAISQAG